MTARLPRFLAQVDLAAESIELSPAESHHASHVLRLTCGAWVELFDGEGRSCPAEMVSARRGAVICRPLAAPERDREIEPPLEIAVSLPKGERQRVLVEKLTELGVNRLIALVTTRGVAQPTEAACRRLESYVVAACKQSGRNRLMEIAAPRAVDAWLHEETGLGAARWIADESAPVAPWPRRSAGAVWIMIGPEGGWTDEERRQAIAAGWTPISLGPLTLRVETAAIAVAAAIRLPANI